MCARSHSLQDSILFETVCDLQEPFFILGFHAGQSPSLNLIEMILAFDIGSPKIHINTYFYRSETHRAAEYPAYVT